MSKIESKEFFVSYTLFCKLTKKGYGYSDGDHAFSLSEDSMRNNKITISWEVPEKVVTIGEEAFSEAYSDVFGGMHSDCFMDLKERLFKDKV